MNEHLIYLIINKETVIKYWCSSRDLYALCTFGQPLWFDPALV